MIPMLPAGALRPLKAELRPRRLAILILALVGLSGSAHAATPDRCAPAEGLRFICGTGAAEEVVRVPGTRWLITSGLNVGTPAHLHAIDMATRQAHALDPTFAAAPAPDPAGCASPPDLARWSSDGLAIARSGDGRIRLFAANHGDRRAIEMFDVTLEKGSPVLRWTGCAALPPNTLGNGIAARSAEEIYVTSFHAPDDSDAWNKMARREPTGSLWRWRAGQGFARVLVGPISGANGIALSSDTRTLYISAWSERALLVIDRPTGRSRRIALDFLPDNIHVAPDGTLLIGGQRTTVTAIGHCGAQCRQAWLVTRLDPNTGRQLVLASGNGSFAVNYACGAIEADGTVYITVRGDDRMTYVSASPRQRPSHQVATLLDE